MRNKSRDSKLVNQELEMAESLSLSDLCRGLPLEPLPPAQPRDPSVPHAPPRTPVLTRDEKKAR